MADWGNATYKSAGETVQRANPTSIAVGIPQGLAVTVLGDDGSGLPGAGTTAVTPAPVPTEGLIWPPRTGAVTVGGGGGGAPTRYTHTQAVLASTWTITHNLGAHPSVSVEDAVGTVLYGTIQYVSDNVLTVTFNRTATGRANLI